MAKGDPSRVQNAIDYQGGTAQNVLNNQMQRNQQLYGNMYGNYQTGTGQNLGTYGNVQNQYQNFLGSSLGNTPPQTATQGTAQPQQDFGNLSDPTAWMSLVNNPDQRLAYVKSIMGPNVSDDLANYYSKKISEQPGANPTEQAGSAEYWKNKMLADPMFGGSSGSNQGAIGGWQNFAQTGGFSPQDIQDMRARSMAPIRAAYQTAQDNISRQRALSGGYSPGYTAAQTKLARDQAYGMSDAETNANAALAQLKQQGQLYGLQGLTGAQLGALSGMTGMYGSTPGLTNTFGNQVLSAANQGFQGANLQNDIMRNVIQGQTARAQLPNRWDTAGTALKDIGMGAGMIAGL